MRTKHTLPLVLFFILLAATGERVYAAVADPIVFVSRQILNDGSIFYSPAKAMPGAGPHSRFRPANPGKLLVREASGTIRVLIDGANPTAGSLSLIDVNAPSVSYDGQRIIFSGLPAPAPGQTYSNTPGEQIGAWRLYVVNADGTNLRKLPIPETTVNLSHFGQSGIWQFDDTYPCWLPDGRIVFTSTRWVVFGQYSGMIGSNLFVVNENGTNLHRITSERSGADRPTIDPLTGKIVFARWWRNYRFPTDRLDTVPRADGFARHLGLSTQFDPNPPSRGAQFEANMWTPASINPDGTNLAAFSLFFRGNETMNHYYGGTFAPDGTLYGNYFPMENMTEASGFGGVRRVHRGAIRYDHIIGNTRRYEHPQITATSFGVETNPSGYAADPAVMADGTLLISLATGNHAALTGEDINQDYGLYNINPTGAPAPILVYDNPGTAELQAQVLAARPVPPIIADSVVNTPSMLPPPATGPYDQDGTFTFHALNVYANGPVDMDIVNAPAVGSAATIKFFIDHQRGSFGSFPSRDFPILLEELPVNVNGSVLSNRAPANVQLFEQLRDADGAVPPTTKGINLDGGAHVAGHNYGRPGTVVRCVGCHAGHTLIPVPANDADALWSNLAPGAVATASSQLNGFTSPQYAVDRRVQKATVNWSTAQGTLNNQWIKLTFPADVIVRTVRLYGAGACTIPNTTVRLFSDQAGLQQVGQNTSGPLATVGTDVAFGDIKGRVVTVELGSPGPSCSNQSSLSVAEVEVIASGASVAAATPVNTPPSTPVSTNAGGGGGCTLNPSAGFDPTIPAIFAFALGYLVWKRHRARRRFSDHDKQAVGHSHPR
ncbi:MAG: JDVT-CTERM domain-containing protein [Nitrospira sp.]|nr:JDVT-CTERM domain-containing protein [Nitrospira sp.]